MRGIRHIPNKHPRKRKERAWSRRSNQRGKLLNTSPNYTVYEKPYWTPSR